MGLVRIAVVRGRPWLASIVVVALTCVLGAVAGTAAIGAGSVNPQNAVALVLLGAKAIDLAFVMGGSGRSLVDRLSGLHVAVVPPSPRRRVLGGLAIDIVLGVAVALRCCWRSRTSGTSPVPRSVRAWRSSRSSCFR